VSYYQLMFAMVQHHKYSMTEVEEMYPFERDLFVEMLKEFLEKQQEQQQGRK